MATPILTVGDLIKYLQTLPQETEFIHRTRMGYSQKGKITISPVIKSELTTYPWVVYGEIIGIYLDISESYEKCPKVPLYTPFSLWSQPYNKKREMGYSYVINADICHRDHLYKYDENRNEEPLDNPEYGVAIRWANKTYPNHWNYDYYPMNGKN